MSRSEENYNYLIQKIDGFIRKFYLNKVFKGIIILMSSFFAAFIVVAFAEFLGNFEPAFRAVLFYSFVLSNLLVLVYYIVLPLLAYFKLGKSIDYAQASVIIGDHFQPIRDKLLNTLQLKKLSTINPGQQTLIEASIDQKIAELKIIPFSSAIKYGDNRRFLKYALMPLGLIVIVFFAAPSILSDSTTRLLNYNKKFVKKAPFAFIILNKNLNVLQGDDLTLEIKLSGNELPAELYLEDGPNAFKLEKEDLAHFSHTFKNLQKSKLIRIRGAEFTSEEYWIEVTPKPGLMDFDIQLDYPSYLRKNREILNNTGDITVPAGTRVYWNFRAQNSEEIAISLNSGKYLMKPSSAGTFNFTHQALESQNYTVQAFRSGKVKSDLVSYQIRTIPDLSPAIEVTERIDSVNSKVLYFVGEVNDDHGFSRLTFNYTIHNEVNLNEKKTISKSINIEKNSVQSNFFYIWDIAELNVKPGDDINYYLEVFDNDGVNGAKSTKSAVRSFKIPSQRDLERKLDSNSDQIKDKMAEAIRQAGQVEKEAKRLNQDLINKKSLSYDEKKQIANLLQKQKELENLVQQIQKDNKQNQFDQQQNIKLTEDILEKQKQIEDLFNNVLDEKTRELLKNIEKLLEQNNKSQTQNELSKVQLDNKSLQKELDRILELYKQLEFDQKLDQTISKLKEQAEKQKDLSNDSRGKTRSSDELLKDQEKLNSDFSEIKKDLEELEQSNDELEQKNDFENPKTEQQQIEKEQKQGLDNLQNKNQKQAAENQKNAAEQMEKLSDKLSNMQQEGEEEENQINARSLREILDNLLTSSFDQEQTMQAVKSTNPSDPGYSLQTQKQKEIKDNLKMIEDSLYLLSKKVPQIESVVNKEIQTINLNISNAIESLSERKTPEANRNQQLAMTSINNLALMLNEALEQLQNAMQNAKPGGKGKGKPSLSQLSKMQDQLNKNMQKAREQMQQGKPNQQGPGRSGGQNLSEQLARMAREQQMIRQAIQELNRLENKDGQGKLGNLGQLVKEMEQTETDLVNKKILQETIIRQQDILTKLLDAEKADREREQDDKRESKEAKIQSPDYKILLQEYQRIKQKDTDLLKTVPPGLSSFYKIKVGDYFKNLNSGYK